MIETKDGRRLPIFQIPYHNDFISYFVIDKILYYGKSSVPEVSRINAAQKYHDHALHGHN